MRVVAVTLTGVLHHGYYSTLTGSQCRAAVCCDDDESVK